MEGQKSLDAYMTAVALCGAICILAAGILAPFEKIDLQFLFLVGFTVGLGSRITVQIPRVKSHISVSDTFIFLTLLLYGGEWAIVLAGVEAAVSSWRFCNRKITVAFNAGAMAVSTAAVVGVLSLGGLNEEAKLLGGPGHGKSFVIALSLMALTQFSVNTSLAALHDRLNIGLPLWETWKNKYIWTFISYFFGVLGAGMLVQLSNTLGLGLLIAVLPVILFVYLTYRMYLNKVETSLSQAEQAERYAGALEEQAAALRESEERFRSAFDHAPIGIALVGLDGRWLKVNRALCDILGYLEVELLETDLQSIIVPEDLSATLVRIDDVASGRVASSQMEHRYVHRSGRTVWASWSVSSASDFETGKRNLIFQVQDITDRKVAEERLHFDATHDELTGLANRSLFMRRLTAELRRSRSRTGHRVSVLFIDLDRFKNVNDSLGHLFGDRLLVEISRRVRDCLRPDDLVARLGGDEFVILVSGNHERNEAVRIAERIQEQFSIPFDLSGHEVYSSASIGILHASEKHMSAEDMMRDADTAMYQAKRAGKARHEVFDEKMHKAAKETLRLETDLRRAIERDDFVVFYQPIYLLATGEIEGVEALARWRHPELGDIPPQKFIEIAEEIGMIDALAEIVIRRACVEFARIRAAAAPTPISLSVNLSCRQFANPKLVETIQTILHETNFPPSNLKLEITETVFFEYKQTAIKMLHQLRDMGIELNVDDFGTGYSNLGYLTSLPISRLKIDRSFVWMFDDSGASPAIVQTIIMLARNLGLRVVAEGVETETQLAELKKLDCDAAQGYLFARPMDLNEICRFLAGDDLAGMADPAFSDVQSVPVVQ